MTSRATSTGRHTTWIASGMLATALALTLQPTPVDADPTPASQAGSCDLVWNLLSDPAQPGGYPTGEVSVRERDYAIAGVSSMAPVTVDADGRFRLEASVYAANERSPAWLGVRFGRALSLESQRFEYAVWVSSCSGREGCEPGTAAPTELHHCRRHGDSATLVVDRPSSGQQLLVQFRR